MIVLRSKADKIIENKVFSNGVRAFYYSVCEKYAKGYTQTFITEMQNLITKLGIMISDASINQKNITYCSQSICYLCNEVLDSSSLEKSFESIGLNDKGNQGKHTISTNRIDMDKCVQLYNSLINNIMSNYPLPSLKHMIVYKRVDSPNHNNTNKSTQTISNANRETASIQDENLVRIKANIRNGHGRYQKGLIHKTPMLNFNLDVSIANPKNYKIVSAIATVKCGRNEITERLSENPISTKEFDVEISKFSGNISVIVVVTYKLAFLKTKLIKVTVSKFF